MSILNLQNTVSIISYSIIVVALLLGQSTVQAASNPELAVVIEQGDNALAAGQLDTALASFQKAAEIKPDTEQVQHKLASVYLLKGEYANSIQYFHKTLGFNAKNSKAFIGLSLAYLHTGQYALAKAALDEAKLYSDKTEDIDKILDWIKSKQQH